MGIAAAIFLAWSAAVGFMYATQDQQLYFPSATLQSTPADIGLTFTDLNLTSEDGTQIHGWLIPAAIEDAPLVLFFHGNAGNISHRLASLRIFHELGLNVLIIDYRGYGQSSGTPSETGLYQDAQSAWQYARNEMGFEPDKIILFGRSLGAAVAAHLAVNTAQPPGALMLESAFTSAPDLGAELLPWMPVQQLIRVDYNTRLYLSQNQAPVWIAHALHDEIVPFEHGKTLYQSANQPKYFLELAGGHNDGFLQTQPDYQQHIKEMLKELGRL